MTQPPSPLTMLLSRHTRRRKFITLLGGAAVAWPFSVRAQQGERMRRIGVLMFTTSDEPESQARITALGQGLQEAGWSVGRNVRIDVRWSGGDFERVRRDAQELVSLGPDVLVAGIGPTTQAFQQISRTLPIVFAQSVDPVGLGIVKSMARPGGNATGFTQFEYTLSAKWLELLREVAPQIARVGFVRDAGGFAVSLGQWAVIGAAAAPLGVEVSENVAIEYSWADGKYDRLPALALELVRRQVSVIFTGANAATFAAKAATTTIPIVFILAEDPVQLGLVASVPQPGGNATGINFVSGELTAKRLELLHELVPAAARVAVLVNPADATATETTLRELEPAVRAIGLKNQVLKATTSQEIHAAFAAMVRERSEALFLSSDAFFTSRRVQLATLSARHGIPLAPRRVKLSKPGG